jgi:alcohol dehydrogenase
LAGAAIENSMLGAAHACANPLTARYDITHGIAVGVMLPHVIKFNSQVVNGYYADLLASAGILSHKQRGERLSDRIIELKVAAELPQHLHECGVDESGLPELAKAAATQWTGKFNPRPVMEKELLELYEAAF